MYEPFQVATLLYATQLARRKETDPRDILEQLEIDIRVAIPLSDPILEEKCQDLTTAVQIGKSSKFLIGERLYAYYRLGKYLQDLKDKKKRVSEAQAELDAITGEKGNRTYIIATWIHQLFTIIGPPHLRTYSILAPDIIHRIKRKQWDHICESVQQFQASQELSIQGGNDLLRQEHVIESNRSSYPPEKDNNGSNTEA